VAAFRAGQPGACRASHDAALAYRVGDVDRALEGHEVVLEPFDVGEGFATLAFVNMNGALIEFMQYADPDEEGWF
jgi:hypothetical protein